MALMQPYLPGREIGNSGPRMDEVLTIRDGSPRCVASLWQKMTQKVTRTAT